MALMIEIEEPRSILSTFQFVVYVLDIQQVLFSLDTIMSYMTFSETYCPIPQRLIKQLECQIPFNGVTLNDLNDCNFIIYICVYILNEEYNITIDSRRHLPIYRYSKEEKRLIQMSLIQQLNQYCINPRRRLITSIILWGSQYCVEETLRCLNPVPLSPTLSPTFSPNHFLVHKALSGVYNVSLSIHRHAGYSRAH